MRPVIFRKVDGGKLEIGTAALERMLVYVQRSADQAEAGGVLMGRYILDSADIVVDEITVPMGGDRRGRQRFYRNRRGHQAAIDRPWRLSQGTCTYLGEWHTHPEPEPAPSGVDLVDWDARVRQDVFDGDSLYFVIVGTQCLRVWEVGREDWHHQLIGEYVHIGGQVVEDHNST